MNIFMGIFLILHALVHLLYAGQSRRFFELRPGMTWPDGSWAFSNLPATRLPVGWLPFHWYWRLSVMSPGERGFSSINRGGVPSQSERPR